MQNLKSASLALMLGILATTSQAENRRQTIAPATDLVWQHHISAWTARDLKAIVGDYAEDSLLIVNGRSYVGRDQIRGVFSRLFRIFDNGENKIDDPVVTGRIVYITWHFRPKGETEFFGTDTFVIENGRISVQTIASPLYEAHSERN